MVQLQLLVEHQNLQAVDQRHQHRQHHQGRALLPGQGHPGNARPVGQHGPGKHAGRHGRHEHAAQPHAPYPCQRHGQCHHGHGRQQPRHAGPAPAQPPGQHHHGQSRQQVPAGACVPQRISPRAKTIAHLAHHHRQAHTGCKPVGDRDRKKPRHRRQPQHPQQPLEHKGQSHRGTADRQHLARAQAQAGGRAVGGCQHGSKQQCHHRGRCIHHSGTGRRQGQQQAG